MTPLFDSVVDYCHNEYISSTCNNCNHSNNQCPGSSSGNCRQCLEEVHYPARHSNGRRDYECQRMLHFYVCRYTAKYASEMLYLMRKSDAMQTIDNYNVLSIGCGATPDLIALERFCDENSATKTIDYIGIDSNERWRSIHDVISSYQTPTVDRVRFRYLDAVDDDISTDEANVVILQYVISHFCNNRQIDQIDNFFVKLVNDVVAHRQRSVPMAILINDVNSCNRGRNRFSLLVDKLRAANLHVEDRKHYFDYKIFDDEQRYGERHDSLQTVFEVPDEFEFYDPWRQCSSAQLLIEVE